MFTEPESKVPPYNLTMFNVPDRDTEPLTTTIALAVVLVKTPVPVHVFVEESCNVNVISPVNV